MVLQKVRREADATRAKLDRARRLYRHLARVPLRFGRDETLLRCVQRMKASGLYAKSTTGGDIAYSLICYCYRSECGRHCNMTHWQEWVSNRFPVWWSGNRVFRRKLAAA
jgi:hypothetical protein